MGRGVQDRLVGPPDPAIVGARWRDMWVQRLEATPPVLAEWLFAPAVRASGSMARWRWITRASNVRCM